MHSTGRSPWAKQKEACPSFSKIFQYILSKYWLHLTTTSCSTTTRTSGDVDSVIIVAWVMLSCFQFISYPLRVLLVLVDATIQAVIPKIHCSQSGLIWEGEVPGKLAGVALAEELVENVANLLFCTALAPMTFICSPGVSPEWTFF